MQPLDVLSRLLTMEFAHQWVPVLVHEDGSACQNGASTLPGSFTEFPARVTLADGSTAPRLYSVSGPRGIEDHDVMVQRIVRVSPDTLFYVIEGAERASRKREIIFAVLDERDPGNPTLRIGLTFAPYHIADVVDMTENVWPVGG